MTEDAKLTDFLEDGRVESGVEGAESQADESTDSSSESTDSSSESSKSSDESTGKSGDPAGTAPGTVERAVTTYGWGTYRCSRCEVVTDCVWRSTEEFVCPDCKQW